MSSSTPDALWGAPSNRLLRPAAVRVSSLRRGRLLDGCSLAVPVGARVLVVGEPEASASALLRVLAGLTPADAGRVEVAGLADPFAEGRGRRVAYLGPEPGIRAWMTPRETLTLTAELLELSPAEIPRRVERVLRWARLAPAVMDVPVRRGGLPLLQRVGLAAALLGDPEVLLLDEPLRALDAPERVRLLQVPGGRRTVLLASRYPASEAGLVGHVVLIRHGRVALIARVGELEAAGLPLSSRGIATLAELHAAVSTRPAPGGEGVHATGDR